MPTYDFTKFSKKMHEIEKSLDRKGPLRSATGWAEVVQYNCPDQQCVETLLQKALWCNSYISIGNIICITGRAYRKGLCYLSDIVGDDPKFVTNVAFQEKWPYLLTRLEYQGPINGLVY